MLTRLVSILACAVYFFSRHGAQAVAVATWPSSIDELEDIMFLNTGYQARGFAEPVTPCSSEGVEGFISAAQWLRLAFHDAATGNVATGVGGLDASIVYEMDSDTNNSPGLNVSLQQFAPYLSTRSSMSDLIALGVYTSVRGCGGPVVPIRGGRVDATAAGPNPDVFLPLPQNSIYTFEAQFQRIGFSTTQMIAVVACGHTIGQVHASTFPQIATHGTAPLDSTPTVFDQEIAVEYLAGTSTDPMIVGTNSGFNSDLHVFEADNNVTIASLANPGTFDSTCSAVLQQMIEVVPSGVTLTSPIVPYDIKPYTLQLTLMDGGALFSFTGQIRIRTTNFQPGEVAGIQIVYADRNGGTNCGPSGCTVDSIHAGSSAGFDDTFEFYSFSTQIPTVSSISSFNVIVTFAGGVTAQYNNNDAGFPVQDTIMLQSPESCLSNTFASQNLTVVAAIRNTVTSSTVNLILTQSVPVAGLMVPALQTTSLSMSLLSTVGNYNLYAATTTLNIYQLANTNVKFDVSVATGASTVADSFKNTNQLPSICSSLSPTAASTATSFSSTSSPTTITTTSVGPTGSAPPGWSALGCYTDNVNGGRTLRSGEPVPGGAPAMTVELCAAACKAAGFILAGVEYSQECWCDNTLNNGGGPAHDGSAGCNMPCKGNALEMCGGSNRLNMYILTSTSTSTTTSTTSASSTSTSTPPVTSTSTNSNPTTSSPTVSTSTSATTSASAIASAPPGWTALGCYSDNAAGRALPNGESVPGGAANMTVELCVAACEVAGFSIAGVEYSQECWCNNAFSNGGGPAPDGNAGCDMPCRGNTLEICGGPNRLNVYSLGVASTSNVPTTTSTIVALSSTSTLFTTSTSLTISTSTPISSTSSISPTSNTFITSTSSSTSTTLSTSSTLSTFSSSFTSATSSTSSSSTSSFSPSIRSSTSTASTTIAATPARWTALGCYADNVNSGRTLQNNENVPGGGSAMTVELCITACKSAGFLLAGVEYAQECWCDNTFNSGGPAPDGNAGCDMPCNGNNTETCGGPNRLNVYKNLNYVQVVNPNTTGYTYQGCYSEANGGRALTSSSTASDSMTVEVCAAFCDGTTYFGVEYGRECYCGASLATTSTLQPASQCSFTCAGNSSEYCGAGNRLNLYELN